MITWFTCGSINAGGQLQGCGHRHRLRHSAEAQAARAAALLADRAHQRLQAGLSGTEAAGVVLDAGRARRASWPEHLLEAQGGEPAANPWWTP